MTDYNYFITYTTPPMQDERENSSDAIIYSLLLPVNKDTMTYHDSLEFVRIFFSMFMLRQRLTPGGVSTEGDWIQCAVWLL